MSRLIPTNLRTNRTTTSHARRGLLTLTVAFSAGIHAALVPEHLREMPPLGYLFIIAAAVRIAIAIALVTRPNDARSPRLAILFLVTQIVAWAMFIALHIPGFIGTPEPVEPIALVCKATELLGIALALPLAVGAAPLRRPLS
jgi:4-amino-4-deoxy-L-arabinose transferase-like glycosyltransferase